MSGSPRPVRPLRKADALFAEGVPARQPIEVTMNEHAQTATSAPLFNPLAPEFIRDPYPSYERLRNNDPMHVTQFGAFRRQPACRSKPGAARQTLRQGFRRPHDPPLRAEDHGRAGVPQHEPLDAATGPAGPHAAARPRRQGVHGPAGRGHAAAHPGDRRSDAGPYCPAGAHGPDRGFRVPPAGDDHLRHARESPKIIARCFMRARATAAACSTRCR